MSGKKVTPLTGLASRSNISFFSSESKAKNKPNQNKHLTSKSCKRLFHLSPLKRGINLTFSKEIFMFATMVIEVLYIIRERRFKILYLVSKTGWKKL